MIDIRFDRSRAREVPPHITELFLENVQLADFKGNNFPGTFPTIIDTGTKYCVFPMAIFDAKRADGVTPILELERVGFIKVRGFENGADAYKDRDLFKLRMTIPPDGPINVYGIFAKTDEILVGQTALRDHVLNVNYATGNGALGPNRF